MIKRIKKLPLFTQKKFLFFLNPLAIILLGLFFTIFFNPTSKFTVLVYSPLKTDRISYPKKELLKNKKIKGEFTARENNLGIVSVRFYNFERISADKVLFSITLKGSNKWYYQNSYKVDQFQPDQFFTFGFPLIPDSMGKIYEFEVKSLSGKTGNAIGVSRVKPTFVTHYQISKLEILSKPTAFAQYVSQKAESIATFKDAVLSSVFFFLPFFYYLIILIFIKIEKLSFLLLTILTFLIFYETYFFNNYGYTAFYVFGSFWIISALIGRIEDKFFYVLSLIFLIFIPLNLIASNEIAANKLGRWVYLFLSSGLLMSYIQLKRKQKIKLLEFSND